MIKRILTKSHFDVENHEFDDSCLMRSFNERVERGSTLATTTKTMTSHTSSTKANVEGKCHKLGLKQGWSEYDSEVGCGHLVEAFVSGDATQVSHDESEGAEDRFDKSSYHLRHDRHRLLPAQVPRRFVLQKERNIIIKHAKHSN